MDIEHHPDESAYRVHVGGKRLAEMTYRRDGDVVVILHTWVADDLRGHGIAGKLVAAAVADARAEACGIHAVCAYAKRVFESTPAYADVFRP